MTTLTLLPKELVLDLVHQPHSGVTPSRRNIMKVAALGSGLALAGVAVSAMPSQAAVAGLTPITKFPNEDHTRVSRHLNLARQIAEDDLYPFFAQRGILDQVYPVLDDAMQTPGLLEPIRVFDDVYFVGQAGVSAWAVETSDGLVVFDALNDADEAEHILVQGLRSLGFTPDDIKYVVVTHEHRDHFGGAKYLQETYGARVVASEPAWVSMASQAGTPTRDETVADGQAWTVGGKTFNFHITPGHTAGSLSTIIPVTDGGSKHVAALYGGFGIPRTAEGKMTQIASLRAFSGPTSKAGVDVILGNHQVQDQSLYKFDLTKHRRFQNGRALDPNPFVLRDPRAYSRFLALQEQCIRVLAARVGQALPDQDVSPYVWSGYRGVPHYS